MGERGVTFVEMLVVIVIIAILSGLTSSGVYCAVIDADVKAERAEGRGVAEAVATFYHLNEGEMPVAGQVSISEEENQLISDSVPVEGDFDFTGSVYELDSDVDTILDSDEPVVGDYYIIYDSESEFNGSVVRLNGTRSCTGDQFVVEMGTVREILVDRKLQNEIGEDYWDRLQGELDN